MIPQTNNSTTLQLLHHTKNQRKSSNSQRSSGIGRDTKTFKVVRKPQIWLRLVHTMGFFFFVVWRIRRVAMVQGSVLGSKMGSQVPRLVEQGSIVVHKLRLVRKWGIAGPKTMARQLRTESGVANNTGLVWFDSAISQFSISCVRSLPGSI